MPSRWPSWRCRPCRAAPLRDRSVGRGLSSASAGVAARPPPGRPGRARSSPSVRSSHGASSPGTASTTGDGLRTDGHAELTSDAAGVARMSKFHEMRGESLAALRTNIGMSVLHAPGAYRAPTLGRPPAGLSFQRVFAFASISRTQTATPPSPNARRERPRLASHALIGSCGRTPRAARPSPRRRRGSDRCERRPRRRGRRTASLRGTGRSGRSCPGVSVGLRGRLAQNRPQARKAQDPLAPRLARTLLDARGPHARGPTTPAPLSSMPFPWTASITSAWPPHATTPSGSRADHRRRTRKPARRHSPAPSQPTDRHPAATPR